MGRCEEMAREALQEARRAVRALHPAGLEQQTDVEALRRLARDYAIATGMQVEVTAGDAAPPTSLGPGVGLRSMSERARSIGGEIAFEPGSPGLTIRVMVPVKQEVAG